MLKIQIADLNEAHLAQSRPSGFRHLVKNGIDPKTKHPSESLLSDVLFHNIPERLEVCHLADLILEPCARQYSDNC
jgi:hypothetical protein